MPLGAVHPIIASEAKQSIVRLSKKLDCFAALAMTAVGQSHTSAFSRRECVRGVRGFPPFPWEGRGECRVPTHPQPRMQSKKAYELVTTGRPDYPAFPHAMVLTGSFVISPVIGLVCHRRLAVDPQSLTPASRRQDHTTSPSAFSTVRQRCLIASIASRPASVTIASAPRRDETARLGKCFASERKQDIFSDWAGQVICETARPASLRAQRSNPASEPQSWIASSLRSSQ